MLMSTAVDINGGRFNDENKTRMLMSNAGNEVGVEICRDGERDEGEL